MSHEVVKKKKILIVDDEEVNLKLLDTILRSQGYETEKAANGIAAIEKAPTFLPDIILLDIMMPQLDGFEVCRRLKADQQLKHIPVIMLTALTDQESKLSGLDAGASDFLYKPVDHTELIIRTRNLLRVKEYEDFLKIYSGLLEEKIKERMEQLDKASRETKQAYVDTISRLTVVAEYKDEDTSAHIKRVGVFCTMMAREMKLPSDLIDAISYASPMHDIGKIGVPSDILLKPGKLIKEEFELVKLHTTIGGKIFSGSPSIILQMAERIALYHHERWDGTGYPKGLKGDAIPIEARIMNIIDQYDALRSHRPYKQALSHDKVVRIITVGDGRTMPSHFEPAVLDTFVKISKDICDTFEEHRSL